MSTFRYDREIDRAERSALRRILEKDDSPQKRMVLCISDIKKVCTIHCLIYISVTTEFNDKEHWSTIRTGIN